MNWSILQTKMKGWMEAKKQFPWMFAVTRIIGSNMETQEEKRRPPHGVFKGARNSLHPGLRRKASLIDQESIVSAWYHLTTEALMF